MEIQEITYNKFLKISLDTPCKQCDEDKYNDCLSSFKECKAFTQFENKGEYPSYQIGKFIKMNICFICRDKKGEHCDDGSCLKRIRFDRRR